MDDEIIILIAGGAVRDMLLGRKESDTDYLVASGSVPAFLSLFPDARPVGKSYPVFYLNGREFTFPREDGSTFDDRIDRDLAARDFTMNALALGPDGELYAHPMALSDIAHKKLRPASETTFTDDPLRVYRAAAFYARFSSFTPAPELITLMKECAGAELLDNVYPDRIGMEVRKALNGERPGNFLRLLDMADCLDPWFKELAAASLIPAGPRRYHGEASVLDHTAELMDRLAGNPLHCWAALCHDLGKLLTPKEKLPSHHGHDKNGMDIAIKLAKRLRLPNRYLTAGEIAARFHMVAGKYPQLRPGTKVDLLMKLHATSTLSLMRDLCRVDKGQDVLAAADSDLKKILKVKLEKKDRNKGSKSGEKLRSLRAQALSS